MPTTSAALVFWLSAEFFEVYALVWWHVNSLEINISIIAGGPKIQLRISVMV